MNEIDPGKLNAILVRIIQITNADRIEIYPLDDDLVQSKFVKGVYKNHLHGLLFKLGQLSFKKDTIAITRKFEALPGLVLSVPDSPITIDVDQVHDNDRHRKRRYYINIHNSPTRKKPLTRECRRILNTLSSEFIAKVQEIQPNPKRKVSVDVQEIRQPKSQPQHIPKRKVSVDVDSEDEDRAIHQNKSKILSD